MPPPDPTLDERMMRRALAQAQQAAALGEVPIGAVVYRGDEVLAEAHNRREIDRDPTAHAEMLALRLAAARLQSWRLVDCTLAVTLEPCPMCAGAIVNARISHLTFGPADPKMGAVTTLYQLCTDPRLNHRVTITPNLLAEESAKLLTEFFKGLRR